MQILKKYKLISYHVIFWLTYVFIHALLEFAAAPETFFFSLPDIFFSESPNICTTYLCLFVFYQYLDPLKITRLILGLVLVYIISYAHWYLTGYIIRPYIRANGAPPPPLQFWHFAATALWIFIKYLIFAFCYYYARENTRREKQLRLAEKEKHEAEYSFLRAQINPHFLNNTLNFFYAKSLPLSKELADGIMTLSEMMSYSLAIDKDNPLTPIDEEIAHIENIIKINQLRFNHKLQLQFKVLGNTHNVKVVPLVLITVVENILKHGNCTDKNHPVKIVLVVSDQNTIRLSTHNKKKKGPKELSSGIGMDNIRKRLAHQYENQYSLHITDTEDDYSLDLILPKNAIAETNQKDFAPSFSKSTAKDLYPSS